MPAVCGLRIGIPMLKSLIPKLLMLFGLIMPFMVLADACRPGGAVSPGGGPLAVENGWIPKPFAPGMGPDGDKGVGGPIPPGCPLRTPSGFLEKLKRMPPFTLLCSGCP